MGKTVLIIDDDLSFAEMAGTLLEDRGLVPIIARGGAQAKERLRSCTPDAILLDLNMPGTDGRQMLRWLKSEPQTRDIPVLICTITEVDVGGELLERGAADFIHKTSYLRDLGPRVERALSPSGPPR